MTQHLEFIRDSELIDFPVGAHQLRAALLMRPDTNGSGSEGTLVLALLPPNDVAPTARARQLVFLLDRSGSMEGWRLQASGRGLAAILETLTEDDWFAVYAFDDRVEAPPGFPDASLVPANPANRAEAIRYLLGLTPRGGTEMAELLDRALAALGASDPTRDRCILLVTDGQAGNEKQILQQLGDRLEGIRFFVVGIERAVSTGFLRYLADLDNGAFELADSETRLHDTLNRFHRRLAVPILTDLHLETDGFQLLEDPGRPLRFPDLYPGTPVSLLGRWQGEPGGTVRLSATDAAGEPWAAVIPMHVTDNEALFEAWRASQPADVSASAPPAQAVELGVTNDRDVEEEPRRPRRSVAREIEIAGERREEEVPFVVGVLADLSGQPREALKPIKLRRFQTIDAANLDAAIEAANARLALHVPNRFARDGSKLSLELTFQRLSDFSANSVLEKLDPAKGACEERDTWDGLRGIVETNERLRELLARVFEKPERAAALSTLIQETSRARILLGQMDVPKPEQTAEGIRRALARVTLPDHVPTSDVAGTLRRWSEDVEHLLTTQLQEFLLHPDFIRLETTWIGLDLLTRAARPATSVVIRVLNITKRDLLKDLEKSPEFDQSALHKIFREEPAGPDGGEPFGLLLGDYEFGPKAEELGLLRMIAQIAAGVQAPFVAAANPALINLPGFAELDGGGRLVEPLSNAWKTLRDHESANFVGLIVPRVRLSALRSHEEWPAAQALGPWASAAWIFAAAAVHAFTRDGRLERCVGDELNLPSGALETACPPDRIREFAEHGFLCLGVDTTTGIPCFATAQSCQRSRSHADPKTEQAGHHLGQINNLLELSRFGHALRLMARDRLRTGWPMQDCEAGLNDWLARSLSSSEGGLPQAIAEGRVELREARGQPSLIVWLRPTTEEPNEPAPMLRLAMSVPK